MSNGAYPTSYLPRDANSVFGVYSKYLLLAIASTGILVENSRGQNPAEFGSYGVGYAELEFDAVAWYPSDAVTLDFPTAMYRYGSPDSIDFPAFDFPSHIALSEPPLSPSHQFPLIFAYHGSGAAPNQWSFIAERLASHGFVVVAPQVLGEGKELISRMTDKNSDQNDLFFESLNLEQIGTLGLSAGAVAAIREAKDNDEIRATMPISGGAFIHEGIDIPTFLVTGTRDFREHESVDLFSMLTAEPRYLANIENAGHVSFVEFCTRIDYLKANAGPDWLISAFENFADFGCKPEHIDNTSAFELTSFYAVSFFKSHLVGDSTYEKFLTDDFATSSGLPVEIQRTPGFVNVVGDFTDDGQINERDIDSLSQAIRETSDEISFDLDDSSIVDSSDHSFLISKILNTWFGDANLDGEFDTSDLVLVFQNGEYEDESPKNSGWASGDWNGDGDFDSGDLVVAFQDGGFEQGIRPASTIVPEPDSQILFAIGLLALFGNKSQKFI